MVLGSLGFTYRTECRERKPSVDVAKRRELIRRAFVVLECVWHHLYQDVLFRALEVSHETSNNLCIAIQQLYCAWAMALVSGPLPRL